MHSRHPDPALVKTMFRYDPATGELFWRVSQGTMKVGQRAGTLTLDGYLKVRIRRKAYLVHRVVWAMTYGKWPTQQIDHIDNDPANNRISNLREVSQWRNHQNRRHKSNTGVPGVSWIGYRASIRVRGKRKYLGYFDTLEEAKEAYLAAAAKYHGFVEEDA